MGTDENAIYNTAHKMLASEDAYKQMANAVSPYGDGNASARIRFLLMNHLGISTPPETMWTF